MAYTRQLSFIIDPNKGLVSTFSWDAYAADGNSDGNAITCAFAPKTKGDIINPQQETVFLGTKNSGFTIQTFRDDLTQDGSTDFTAEAITSRLDPTLGEQGFASAKRFTHLDFPGINTWEEGLTVEFTKEVNDPSVDPATWNSMFRSSGQSKATIPNGVARWIHLRIRDTNSMKLTPTVNAFTLQYYDIDTGVQPEDT